MGCPSSESGGNRTAAPFQLEMANCTISLSSIPRSRRRRPIHLPVPDDSPGRPRRLSRPSPTTLPAVPDDSPGRPRRLSRPSPTTLPATPPHTLTTLRRLSDDSLLAFVTTLITPTPNWCPFSTTSTADSDALATTTYHTSASSIDTFLMTVVYYLAFQFHSAFDRGRDFSSRISRNRGFFFDSSERRSLATCRKPVLCYQNKTPTILAKRSPCLVKIPQVL